MSNENSPPATETPPVVQAPQPSPLPVPQLFSCPHCSAPVTQGSSFCGNCGNPLPPIGPTFAPPSAPKRSRSGLIIGVVLIVLIVGGGVGYFLYWNNQQQQIVLQAAKSSEQSAANQLPNQITFTCLTVTTDNSHLTYSQYSGYSGYLTLSQTVGLSNPTNFAMDATWKFTYDYTSVGLTITSSSSFHMAAHGVAHPVFIFTVTGQQYNSMPANPDLSKYTGSLDATYQVVGTYSTYSVPQHVSFDSSTSGSSGGTVGSSSGSNLPRC